MLKIIRIISILVYMAWTLSIGIIMGIFRPRHPNIVYYITKLMAWKGMAILGVEYERRGLELHENIGSAIYCCNHQNNIDMIPGGGCVQRRTVVLGKTSILWIPFFGQFFWLSGNILIDRSNPFKARASMEKINKKIKEDNLSLWIMPEGTRSRGRGMLPFKKGAFATAIATQCPIAPVVLSTYSNKLKLNKLKSGRIIAQCLPPISTIGMTKEDIPRLLEQTYNAMKKCQAELDKEIYGRSFSTLSEDLRAKI